MAIDKIDRVVLSKSVRDDIDSKATKTELSNAVGDLENQISAVVSNMDWKESVATYADLATEYPTPVDGWTVNVKDTDITYRYSGTAWIEISANSIPLATSEVDGKMSKEDKVKLDTIAEGAQVNLTATEMLTALMTVDTNESGLNANTLQGKTASDFATSTHDHDGRYYTETEINTLLNGKSGTGHTHPYAPDTHPAQVATSAVLGHIKSGTDIVVDASGNVSVKSASNLGNAVNVTDYNTLVPSAIAQGNITPIKATASANAPWNNTTSGFLVQSNAIDSFHILIFRSGGDGWAYRSYYQGTWGSWKMWATDGHNHDDRYYTESEADSKFATKSEVGSAGYGDMMKSVYDTDNDGVVDVSQRTYTADKLKLYSTPNSSNVYQNHFTKIASVTLTAQYQDAQFVAQLMDYSHGAVTMSKGQLYFRVKQQASLGSAPNVDLKLVDAEAWDNTNFVAVTTSVTASQTVVDLYYKANLTYSIMSLSVVSIVGNMNMLNGQPFVSTLPTGTQTACAIGGRVATADKWTSVRTLTLSGDASGSVSIDGSTNVTLTVTVVDDSHNHTIGTITGLQTALNGKSDTSHNHDTVYAKKAGDTVSYMDFGNFRIQGNTTDKSLDIIFLG